MPDERNIDRELAQSKEAQSKRSGDLFTGKEGLIRNVWKLVTSNQSALRLALLLLALVMTVFGSIILTIAGDPPATPGPLYQYSDLMRLVMMIQQKRIPLTASLETRGSTWLQSTQHNDSRVARLLDQWLPIKKLNFHSSNSILNDINFYAQNYKVFQTTGSILLMAANVILTVVAIVFWLVSRRRKRPTVDVKAILKSFLKKQLKRIKRCWRDKSISFNIGTVIGAAIILLHLTVLAIVMVRPNLFAIVVHQVLFLCLTLACLAVTQLPDDREPESTTIASTSNADSAIAAAEQNGNTRKVFTTMQQSIKIDPISTINGDDYARELNPFEVATITKKQEPTTPNHSVDELAEKEVEQILETVNV